MKYGSKHEIAMALSKKRKMKMMADGGMVDGDLDDEHERSLYELMAQGDQPPVASPEVEKQQMSLASKLHEEHEEMEPYAEGGLVEGMSGNEEPDTKPGVTGEPLGDMPMKPGKIEHSSISEEAIKAIMEKKKKRMFK